MDNGGRLTISTSNTTRDLHGRLLSPLDKGRSFIELQVEDTGKGIPQDKLSRIFEPFYTTKEKGSGLGLAMIYGIVQNHDGNIHVTSRVGEGTTFYLYFPSYSSKLKPSIPKPLARVTQGKGNILLVDDEELVRNVATKMLTRLGYEVTSMSEGLEAVEFFQENSHRIDLVMIDMIMPRMDGQQCFRELRKIDPQVRAILSTGYSHNETVQAVLDEGLCGYIHKPYELRQLGDVVAEAINLPKRKDSYVQS